MSKQKTIVLTGGGTAGHVTPHLVLLPYLKEHFSKIEYIGSKTGIEKTLAQNASIPYHSITTCKFVRKHLLKNLSIPFKLYKGTKEAKAVLKEIAPSVVFSKGGFVSVPVVRAAKKLHIPVVLHESDKSPGLANRLTAGKAEVVFTSFEDTAKQFKNGVYSGPPLAPPPAISKKEAKAQLGLTGKLPVLLVTGGSLGAVALNRAVESALPELIKKYQVLHVTGKGNKVSFSHPNYHPYEYTLKMPLFMRAADLALTRGGSNSIFELASQQIPMLIVPLPKGNSRGDQEENAAYFSSRGLSHTLVQSSLSTPALLSALNSLAQNTNKIQAAQQKFLSGSASGLIVKKLVEIAKK